MTTNVFGCDIVELLHEGSRSTVYRARRGSDGEPVVIKMPNAAVPAPRSARALKREAELLESLRGVEGVVRLYALAREKDRWGLVMEDFGAASLQQLGLAGVLTP